MLPWKKQKTYARKVYQWKSWRQKKEKWIKTKKGELTHFLGHYPRFFPTLFPASPQCRDRRGRLPLLKKPHPRLPPNGEEAWIVLFANKGGISLMQRKALFNTRKRPLRLEKGVSLFLFWMFLLARCYLITPRLYTTLYANDSVYSPLHSERGRGWGFRWIIRGL